MAPKCSPREQLPLSHLSGEKKKCVFLSHRFLDPTPGLECDNKRISIFENLLKRF